MKEEGLFKKDTPWVIYNSTKRLVPNFQLVLCFNDTNSNINVNIEVRFITLSFYCTCLQFNKPFRQP